MSAAQTDAIIAEAQDLLFRTIYYAGCIIDDITAFTSPNTESVPDISNPGSYVPNDFCFRHPPIHSHDIQKAFDYRRQEIAVLKAIVDDLLEHKEMYHTAHTALTSRLVELDSLVPIDKVDAASTTPSHIEDLPLESLTCSTVASLSQSTVQQLLIAAGIQPASAFSSMEDYKQYLLQLKSEKMTHIKQQNRLLLSIVDKCVRLRGALIASREARNAV